MTNFRKLQFNWRLMLVQTLTNAIALGLTVLILPGITMPNHNVVSELLASGLLFGLLNAFVRPILQFIMFRFLFITFGLVLVVINMVVLALLSLLTPSRFHTDGYLSLVLAGVLIGVFGLFFETLMGLRPPIQEVGPGPRKREQLFSLGSAPVYISTQIEPPMETLPADVKPSESVS